MSLNNNRTEKEDLEDLCFKDLFKSSSMCTMDDYLSVYYDICTAEKLTDEDLVNRIKENINKTITHEQPNEVPKAKNITFNEVFKVIKIIRNHLLQNDVTPDAPSLIQLDLVECFLKRSKCLKLNSSKLTFWIILLNNTNFIISLNINYK